MCSIKCREIVEDAMLYENLLVNDLDYGAGSGLISLVCLRLREVGKREREKCEDKSKRKFT